VFVCVRLFCVDEVVVDLGEFDFVVGECDFFLGFVVY